MIPLLLTALALAAPAGFRTDAGVAEASPPLHWSPTEGVRWSVALDGPSNATPVLFGGLVCTLAEPVTIACFNRSTGEAEWTATLDVPSALPPEEAQAARKRLASADADDEALQTSQAAFSRLQREARRGSDEATARLEAASAEIDVLRSRVDALAPWRTPADKSILGYTTPTPVTDGHTLYALSGHGVLAAFGLDGSRRWSRWLGAAPAAMRGFDVGTSASPLLVDGVLVVAYGVLRGLDPATGATRWEATEYRDYGTPGVTTSPTRLVTPYGDVFDPQTGEQLARGLADTWYIGPATRGPTAWSVGGRSRPENRKVGHVYAMRWTVGEQAPTTPDWAVRVPTDAAFFTPPAVSGGRVYAVGSAGMLSVFDAETGELRSQQDLRDGLERGVVYPSPVVAGGHLFVSSDTGRTLVMSLGDAPSEIARNDLEPTKATPVFLEHTIFVRGDTRLWCLGGAAP